MRRTILGIETDTQNTAKTFQKADDAGTIDDSYPFREYIMHAPNLVKR